MSANNGFPFAELIHVKVATVIVYFGELPQMWRIEKNARKGIACRNLRDITSDLANVVLCVCCWVVFGTEEVYAFSFSALFSMNISFFGNARIAYAEHINLYYFRKRAFAIHFKLFDRWLHSDEIHLMINFFMNDDFVSFSCSVIPTDWWMVLWWISWEGNNVKYIFGCDIKRCDRVHSKNVRNGMFVVLHRACNSTEPVSEEHLS
jgi:hypothetical protein